MSLRRYIAPFIMALMAILPARADPRLPSIFTVTGVAEDVTSSSAAQAREEARAEGERKALGTLLQRLTLRADWGRLPKVRDADLTVMLQDFEVDSERSSSVRYIAKLTFRFRPEPVRKLLTSIGAAYSETRSKPLIVVPVWQDGDRSLLWNDPNPWRAAWGSLPLSDGLVPMQLPLGDLQDMQTIDSAAALAGDKGTLAALAHRYDDGDILVSQASFSGQLGARQLAITTTRYGGGVQEQNWVVSIRSNAGESDDDVLARGAQGVIDDVNEAWKEATVFQPGNAATLTAVVPITKLRDWVEIRDRLAGIPAIQRDDLMSLSRDAARLEIHYLGDLPQLQLALAQRDLVLSQSASDWTLAVKPASN